MFFDMEGFPLIDDGREYLFGACYLRRRRTALPRLVGAQPRGGEARVRSVRRLGARAVAGSIRACTSITTTTTR